MSNAAFTCDMHRKLADDAKSWVNVVWLMAWATLGLLDALWLFGGENFTHGE